MAATGVATVDCSRHDMKRPCSVGDLQKGERFVSRSRLLLILLMHWHDRQVNVDYLLNSSMLQNAPTQCGISYDIACSYSVRAPMRWEKYGFDTFTGRQITWSVPMFHLNAHRERCRSVFSPYLLLHNGRLNGEGVERRWSMANGYAPATKEMGPGSRNDMLDDVFGDQNWAKVTKLRLCLVLPGSCRSILTYSHSCVSVNTHQGCSRRTRQACQCIRAIYILATGRLGQPMEGDGWSVGSVAQVGPQSL